jgi:transposase
MTVFDTDIKTKARILYVELKNFQAVADKLGKPRSSVARWCDDLRAAHPSVSDQEREEKEAWVLKLRKEARDDPDFNVKKYIEKYNECESVITKALRGDTFKHLNTIEPPVKQVKKKAEEQAEARSLYQQGWSYNQIAAKLQVSKSSLSLWCRDLAAITHPIPQRRTPEHVKNKARELYKSGMTCQAIADQIGIDNRRVYDWCSELIKENKVKAPKKVREPRPRQRNGPQVLTDDEVIELRRIVRETGVKDWRSYAQTYKSSYSCIRMAVLGLSFKHLNEIESPVLPSELTRSRRMRGKSVKGPKIRVSSVDEAKLAEAIALRRADPARWTYGALGTWLREQTGINYRAGPMAAMLLKRDPSLKELEAVSPIVRVRPPKAKAIPKQYKRLSVAELQARAEAKRKMDALIAEEDAYEAWVLAGRPE